MSTRKLRFGTRKDYQRMNEGDVHGALADETEASDATSAAGPNQNKQKQQHSSEHDDDMDAILSMLGDQTDEGSSNSDRSSDDDDEEIRQARLLLQERQTEEKRLRKQAKLDRIAKETERVNESLRMLKTPKKNKGRSSIKQGKSTVASLRKCEDVMTEVDKLMDRNLNIRGNAVSSSSSSCDEMRSSTSSSSEEGSSRAGRRKNKTKKKKKESNKKSGLHKSGKNQKLTSLVKYP